MTCLPTAVSWPVSDWTMPILIVSWAKAPPHANAAESTAATVRTCLRNMEFLPEKWRFLWFGWQITCVARRVNSGRQGWLPSTMPHGPVGRSRHQNGNLRPFATRLAADRRLRKARRAAFHHESVLERIPRAADVGGRRRLVVVAHVVADEVAGDAELHIGLEIGIVIDVDLRYQRLEPVLGGQEVQMRGPHVVAPLLAQQLADRSVDRNGIAGGFHAAKGEMAVRIGDELSAQVHVGLHRVLVLVKAFRRGVPHVDLGAGDRPPR